MLALLVSICIILASGSGAVAQDLPVVRLAGFQEEDRVFTGPALYVIYKEFIVAEGATVTFDSSQSECKILFESYITVDGKLRLIGNDMAISRTNRSEYAAIKLGSNGDVEMLDMARVIDITPYHPTESRLSFISLYCCASRVRIENAVFTDVWGVLSSYTTSATFTGTRFIRSTTQGSYVTFTNSYFSNSTVYGETIHFDGCTFFNDSTIQTVRWGSLARTTFADSVAVFGTCPDNSFSITGCNFVGNLQVFPNDCYSLPNITDSNLCGNGQIVDYGRGQKLVRWPNLFFATQDESVLSRLMSFSRYPIRWNPVATSFISNGAFNDVFPNGVSVQQYCYRPYNLTDKLVDAVRMPRMADNAKQSRSALYFAKMKNVRS